MEVDLEVLELIEVLAPYMPFRDENGNCIVCGYECVDAANRGLETHDEFCEWVRARRLLGDNMV